MARCIVYGVRVMANTPVCKGFCTAWLLRKIYSLAVDYGGGERSSTVKGFRSRAGDESAFSLGVLVALQTTL